MAPMPYQESPSEPASRGSSRPKIGFGLPRQRAEDAPSTTFPLHAVRVVIDEGLVMLFGPDGDPVPPRIFAIAASAQPGAPIPLPNGGTAPARRVAKVLEAQSRGRLAPEKDADAWLEAMLGMGLQPEPATEAELAAETVSCRLTAIGRDLVIRTPAGASFLVVDARDLEGEGAALQTADGRPLTVGKLIDELVAVSSGVDDQSVTCLEMPLPECAVRFEDGALLFQPSSGAAFRMTDDVTGPPEGRVGIFLDNGEPAAMPALLQSLGCPAQDAPACIGGQTSGAGATSPDEGKPRAVRYSLAITPPQPEGIEAERLAVVIIGGLPAGARLSAGIQNGDGIWTISPADLPGLSLELPPHHEDDLALRVSGVAVMDGDGSLGVATKTVTLECPFKTDQPAGIPIAIDAASLCPEPDSLDAIVVRDLPSGARLSAGTYDPGIDGWVLRPGELAGLALIPAGREPATPTLTVMGISLRAGQASSSNSVARVEVALE